MPVNRTLIQKSPASFADYEEKVESYALDADGGRLEIGDTVTLTLKVTGIHEHPGDPSRDLPAQDVLNLAFVKPGGYELHLLTLKSALVRKASTTAG